MGKDFVEKATSGIYIANQVLDSSAATEEIAKTGADADAEVISIADTGATVNMNPVVMLVLKVTPTTGESFQTAGQLMVSRIAVPRAGDKIKIKYNPENTTQFVIV